MYNTSKDLRDSFEQFFADKNHQVLSSASLLPTSPNLLFTNAGMNEQRQRSKANTTHIKKIL